MYSGYRETALLVLRSLRAATLVCLCAHSATASAQEGADASTRAEALEELRSRWNGKSPQERNTLRERFYALRELPAEEREALYSRARRLKRLERQFRDEAPDEVLREVDSLGPERGARRWREHWLSESREFGRRLKGKLPPDVRRELDEASPAERARLLERMCGGPHEKSERFLRHMDRRLGLDEQERRALEELPEPERRRALLRLKRQAFQARVEKHGLPGDLDPERWKQLKELSDEEFLERMQSMELFGPRHPRDRQRTRPIRRSR